MKIAEYLDKYNMTYKDLARVVGVKWQYIWQIAKGHSNPSHNLARQISQATQGEIAVYDVRKCCRTCYHGCECSKGPIMIHGNPVFLEAVNA